jgi:hypothetical protein
LGRWAAWDAAAHIGARTAALLTWPLAAAAAAGLVAALAGRPPPRRAGTREVLVLAMTAPPVGLLVALPQHAVIHCFSAWYLLPAAVVAGAVALVAAARLAAARLGWWAAAALGACFAALLLWRAVPVVADGWVADGSPFEEAPRLEYGHLVVARWAGARTGPGDGLLVDPATGVVGVRTWFLHDRHVRTLGPRESVEGALEGDRAPRLALLSRGRIDPATLGRLAGRYRVSIVGDTLAVDTGRPGGGVEVLELVEGEMTPWWLVARSAVVPPHRLRPAPWREAAYGRGLGLPAREPSPGPAPADAGLAELAARHSLALGGPRAVALEAAIARRLSFRVGAEVCPGLEWVGAEVARSPQGRVTVRLALRALTELAALPRVEAELVAARGRPAARWAVVADDLVSYPAGAVAVASARLPVGTRPGTYRVELRGCARRARGPEVSVRPSAPLPVLGRVGRL